MATNSSKLLGLVLLVAGIGLLVWGFNLYGSFGNKLTRAIDGSIDTKTILVLAGGGICSLLGLVKLVGR